MDILGGGGGGGGGGFTDVSVGWKLNMCITDLMVVSGQLDDYCILAKVD